MSIYSFLGKLHFFDLQAPGNGDRLLVLQRIKNVDNPVLKWELDESYIGEDPKWIHAQFPMAAETGQEYRVRSLSKKNFKRSLDFLIRFFQVEFQAIRGRNEFGFIALDDLDFLGVESCDFKPQNAEPTTSTTVKMSTTPVPTEPPGRKYSRVPIQ